MLHLGGSGRPSPATFETAPWIASSGFTGGASAKSRMSFTPAQITYSPVGSIAYSASPLLGGSAVKAIAFVTGHTVPWLIAYASVALHGWLTLGHVGAVVASALITPGRVAAVVGVELLGILAFYALHRIASAERFGDAQV